MTLELTKKEFKLFIKNNNCKYTKLISNKLETYFVQDLDTGENMLVNIYL